MKTCIIDNFDSFTFNLVDLVARLSGQPRVIKNNQQTAKEILTANDSNIIISPGPGTVERPEDIGVCLDVIANSRKPLLGVCLGHQAIAYHFGGRKSGIIKIITPVHGKATKIFHDGSGLFAGLPNPLMAGRYHSLVVDEEKLASDLRVVARDENGNIMALAHRTAPIYGVQFHPESILTDGGKTMMENFFALTRKANGQQAQQPQEWSAGKNTSNGGGNKKLNQKKILCRPWPTPLSMATIFADYFLGNGPAIWLDGDDKTGWGRDGFSYIGVGKGAGMDAKTNKEILLVDDFSADDHGGGDFLSRLTIAAKEFLFDEETMAGLPPEVASGNFFGGPMGFLSYEGRVLCADALTTAPTKSNNTAVPDGFFILADRLVIEHKASGKKYLLAVGTAEQPMEQWMEQMITKTIKPPIRQKNTLPPATINWRFNKSKYHYIKNITATIAALKRGEAYQLCLTNQLTADVPIEHSPHPFALYCHLRGDNNTPYRGFLALPDKPDKHRPDNIAAAILCFSPESFLQVSPDGKITTMPIKGTLRRGTTTAADAALAKQLLSSEKNHAENIMIVDLLRNDLTRVAKAGSIKVEKICALETFDKVHQLVSTVTAQMADDKNLADLLRASFPGGSMTGAPKIRAMELIEQMEERRRGVYAGVIGYIGAARGARGSATNLAMVIRTLVVEKNHHDWRYGLGIGSGIVVDSNPDDEWQELLWKAAGIIDSLKKIMNVTIDE